MKIITKRDEEKKNFSTFETVLFVLLALLAGFSMGELLDKKLSNIDAQKTSNLIANNKEEDPYLDEFIENYNYILDNYYKEIDKEDLINNAISGMMDSLDDPYSVYMDETEYNNFNITLDGSYEGIGVQIVKDEETGYIKVSSVFDNSPASDAGLKANDLIISMDDEEVKDMDASEFSSMVRKSNKSEFDFKILRDNEEKNIHIVRRVVTLDSVTSETYEIAGKKVGYIYIGIFALNTDKQFKEKLIELEKDGIDYLIIDVRSNTGGHLTAVDSILDMFLSENQIMYQFDQNNNVTKTTGKGHDEKKYKIILLGDSASASASEVLIAGLRENLDCVFIGKKTFGKGTVQQLISLTDGQQYKITVKKWLTPKGNWVNDTEGYIPDIEIDLSEKYLETQSDDDDTQLQRAFEYIKTGK